MSKTKILKFFCRLLCRLEGLIDMLTRQRKEQLKMIEKLRKEKDLKKIKVKKDLPLAVRIGLMKMGFDVELKDN